MLSQDFREFLQSLNDHDVRYLIVGGYAVAVHGHPRYTRDLDVWFEMSLENADRLIAALRAFGFGSLGLTAPDFTVPDRIIQLGYPPSRIDMLSTIPGVTFDECHRSRVESVIDGVPVNVIDLESLKRNKRASGRPQDLADLDNLR